MSSFKKEWNESYSKGDNNILYPQTEVIKFLNRFVCKRNSNGKWNINRLLNEEKMRRLRGLDFACGVGIHAITFNEFDIDSYGIDISEVAVSIAVKNAKAKAVRSDQFTVLSGDSQELPYEEGYFDFVVAESCLDSMPLDIAKRYIAELKRVTKGVIYASFIGHDPSMPGDEFIVETEHEKGTVQTVFNQEKIGNLLGVSQNQFIYFSCVEQTDCVSKKLTSKRYYCVVNSADIGCPC